MIWFDMENSPHVIFLKPIIDNLIENNIKFIITARDYSETIPLLKKNNLPYTVIGGYGGKNKIFKIYNVLKRVFLLMLFILKNGYKIKLSVSHGSRPHCIASRGLGIRTFTMYDYEYTETLIFNKFANYVGIPDMVPVEILKKIGLSEKKLIHYPGLKEENYIWNNKFKKLEFLPDNKIIVTLRPPSMTANYHDEKSDIFFDKLMDKLINNDLLYTICIPRTETQKKYIENRYDIPQNFYIPDEPLPGIDLLYSSDVVISGGGTMNREAVVLGCTVYSIFGGKAGSIDLQLEKNDKMKMIRSVEDIDKIEFKKIDKNRELKISDSTFKFIMKNIMWMYNKP